MFTRGYKGFSEDVPFIVDLITYYKWWFSVAMLVYQRVSEDFLRMSDVSCQVPTDGDPLRFPQDAVDHGEAHRRWDTEPEPGQGQGNSLKASMNQFINPIIYSLLFTFIHFYSARHLFSKGNWCDCLSYPINWRPVLFARHTGVLCVHDIGMRAQATCM